MMVIVMFDKQITAHPDARKIFGRSELKAFFI